MEPHLEIFKTISKLNIHIMISEQDNFKKCLKIYITGERK